MRSFLVEFKKPIEGFRFEADKEVPETIMARHTWYAVTRSKGETIITIDGAFTTRHVFVNSDEFRAMLKDGRAILVKRLTQDEAKERAQLRRSPEACRYVPKRFKLHRKFEH